MPAATDLAGLCALAAALCGLCTLALRGALKLAPPRALFLFAALFISAFLPWAGLPLIAYARGMIGEPSLTTLVLIATALVRHEAASSARSLPLLLAVAIAALTLYPLALGAGPLDPYRWGFGAPAFLAAVLGLALFAQWRRWPLLPCALALAVLAWACGAYESRNLWDYLLDPLLALYALAALPRALWRAFKAG